MSNDGGEAREPTAEQTEEAIDWNAKFRQRLSFVDEKTADELLKVARDFLREQEDTFQTLNRKASATLAAAGFSVTILLGVANLSERLPDFARVVLVFAVLGALFSTYHAVQALWVTEFKGLDFEEISAVVGANPERYGSDPTKLKVDLASNIASIAQHAGRLNVGIARSARYSQVGFVVFVLALGCVAAILPFTMAQSKKSSSDGGGQAKPAASKPSVKQQPSKPTRTTRIDGDGGRNFSIDGGEKTDQGFGNGRPVNKVSPDEK